MSSIHCLVWCVACITWSLLYSKGNFVPLVFVMALIKFGVFRYWTCRIMFHSDLLSLNPRHSFVVFERNEKREQIAFAALNDLIYISFGSYFCNWILVSVHCFPQVVWSMYWRFPVVVGSKINLPDPDIRGYFCTNEGTGRHAPTVNLCEVAS